MTINNEDNEVFTGMFEEDEKHGKGISKSNSEYFEANYVNGLKNGPYIKKKSDDYIEEGEYLDNELHGIIKIDKRGFKAAYRYEYGQKIEEIS